MNLLKRTLQDRSIWKDTRRIFWFSTLSALLGTMNLFADAFISGNMGKDVISAIGTVSLNLPLIMSVTIFLNVSTSGHISQSITTGKKDHAQKSFDFSLALSLFMIAVAGLLMFALQDSLISWRTSSISDPVHAANVTHLANQYFWFSIGSVLIRFFSMRFNILFDVKGYQGRVTFIRLAAIATNAIVSALLAYVANMGIIGFGIGTIASVSVVLMMKLFMLWSIRHEFDIHFNPFRFIHAKFSQIKILKKTWLYLPYEMVYAAIVVGQSFVLTNMFADGLILISMSSGIIFAIVGANGAQPMMAKLVSPLLGEGELDEAKLMTEKILVVSTVRQFLVSLVFVSIFGFALPYIHLYDANHVTLVHAGYIIVGAGMVVGVMAPSFFTGYNLASLSANPKLVTIIDLAATLFSLLIYYVAAVISTSWVSIMVSIMVHRIIADGTMVSLVFMKGQYKSLKKEMA